MEDNNAISKQSDAVNFEEKYNELANEFNRLQETAKQLYNRVKQLENTWMLQRADFLFRIVSENKFDVDLRQKAQTELENFLFPQPEESKEENKED